jgi:hypothetical protein
MKACGRVSLVLVLLVAGCLLPAVGGAQSWTYGPSTGFSFTRFDGCYFPPDGKVYFLGGRYSSEGTDGSIWSFDPETGVYTNTGAVLPHAVSNYFLDVLEDDTGVGIYIVGGRTGPDVFVPYVQVYYPETNTAVYLSGDDWPATPSRLVGGQVAYENKLYVFGGFTSAVSPYMFADTWVFDPSQPPGQRWTNLGVNLNLARGYIYSCVVDGYAYAIGGDTFDGLYLYASTKAERLDLSNPSAGWDDVSVADLPTATGEGRTFGSDTNSGYELAGKIVLVAGGQWPGEWANCYIYDVAANSWASFPGLNQARRNHAGAFVPGPDQGTMWIFGGRYQNDDNILTSSEQYPVDVVATPTPTMTPSPSPLPTSTPTWTPSPSPSPSPSASPTVTPLPSATPTVTPTPEPSSTASPSPTASPTATSSATPLPTATPTVTPSPTPEPFLGVRLLMPATYFAPGDPFWLDAEVGNTDRPEDFVKLFVVLDVFGEYWFWPSWTHYDPPLHPDVDSQTILFTRGIARYTIIEEFAWPDVSGELQGIRFISAVMDLDLTEMIGDMSQIEWGYGPA